MGRLPAKWEFECLPLAQECKSVRLPQLRAGKMKFIPIDTAGEGPDTPEKGWHSLWSLHQPLYRNSAKKAKSWQ